MSDELYYGGTTATILICLVSAIYLTEPSKGFELMSGLCCSFLVFVLPGLFLYVT